MDKARIDLKDGYEKYLESMKRDSVFHVRGTEVGEDTSETTKPRGLDALVKPLGVLH
jgi:hypothetical protein